MGKTLVEFNLGATAEPLEEQANSQGYTLGRQAKKFDDLLFSIYMLYFHLEDDDALIDSLLNKLNKKIVKALKPMKKEEEKDMDIKEVITEKDANGEEKPVLEISKDSGYIREL